MRHRLHRLLAALPVLLLLAAVAAPCAAATHLLTILHTNDHHGRFWRNDNGEYGLAARRSLADRVRTEVRGRGGHVLLLDAGDVNTGVPESDMLDAEPDIRGMNAMGYDAMAVGNHEFDNPMDTLRRQEHLMSFPLLSANIYDADGRRAFTPYRLFELPGLTVAVLGLTTEATAVIGNPKHIHGLTFRPAIDEARDLVPILRPLADVVVALTHLGFDPEGGTGSVALARAVPGIDVIVDGHSHTALTAPVPESGVVIVQAGEYGKYLGRVDLEVEDGRENGRERTVGLAGGGLLPVNLTRMVEAEGGKKRIPVGEVIDEDPSLLALLAPFREKGAEALNAVIGRSEGAFPGEREALRGAEAALGNLACRALMAMTGADVAVMNSGGIRAGLPTGDITYRDILTVKPFGNTICTVSMTASELADYLRTAAAMPPGSGAFAQFAGVGFALSGGVVTNLTVGGRPADPARTYTLAVESYLAAGGDGYPKLIDRKTFRDTGYVDADALREFVAANSPLDPKDFAPDGMARRE
jgi:5'-nucleotidase/UDP-sugar diphosphatase